jgi:hypothetical protein
MERILTLPAQAGEERGRMKGVRWMAPVHLPPLLTSPRWGEE